MICERETQSMDFIYGINFGMFGRRGSLSGPEARESMQQMAKRTHANYVILGPSGVQDTPQSEQIDFAGPNTQSDEELRDIIAYAKELGLKVILKPTVNCKNGVWRAHINFFDNEVPGEPGWGNWFASHRSFQLHYAELAEETGCEMYIVGCEMVMAQRREREWRDLIAEVRKVYSGPISYNTDKYQEENVTWWDCVDVISSSGYYPFGSWKKQLDRIERVVRQYGKPFFFAETGCMSTRGAGTCPNDWKIHGPIDPVEQECWYRELFAQTEKRPWVRGYGLWEWPACLPQSTSAAVNGGYSFYEKPAERVIRNYFTNLIR